MENGGNGEERGQFGNNKNNSSSSSLWDMGFEMLSRPYDWRRTTNYTEAETAFNNAAGRSAGSSSPIRSRDLISSSQSLQQEHHDQPLMMMMDSTNTMQQQQQQQYSATASFYDGSWHVHPDPNLTCLQLGSSSCSLLLGNNGIRPSSSSSSSTPSTTTTSVVIPRCQVDGCHVALLNSRGYHKRHKVCEVHSKATRVEILGIEQRFCQQCSRFHAMTEFDDLKRSCRRRLAGHNERRRKNTATTTSTSINQLQDHQFPGVAATRAAGGGGGFSYLTSLLPPRQHGALSLLSSNSPSWGSGADYSHQSSSAPHDFVAENNRSVITNQYFVPRSSIHQARNKTEDDELPSGGSQPAGDLFSARHFPRS